MQDEVDGEENARLGEKNSKLAEKNLGKKKKKRFITSPDNGKPMSHLTFEEYLSGGEVVYRI